MNSGLQAMKRVCWLLVLLWLVACSGVPSTPRGAVEEVCEQLLAAEYDAVLDRTYEWNPQQPTDGEFDMGVWMEQMAAQRVRGIIRQQMEQFFEQPDNPVVSYEIREERLASDGESAALVVAFVRRDGTRVPYTFTVQRVADGRWRSVKMFR